ncbi:uncharacterized protein METZ01_LOCUS460198 [marine metagenome]|uniref:Uncharacterized protein n=1 Tax=marine metagenome TaxID=408172 RepID=A0A383AI65_9ZZZZ
MPTPIAIRTSPNFDGTMGTTSTEPNPELGVAIKSQAVKALLAAAPSASNIQISLSNDLDGVHPTSERSIYNHYGFVAVTATATTCAGNTVTLNGQFNANQGELQMVDIER